MTTGGLPFFLWKKWISGVFLVFFSLLPANAAIISNNFANINQDQLKALTEDLGSLLAAGSFQHGRLSAFPLGIEMGYQKPFVEVGSDNPVLRDEGSFASADWGFVSASLLNPALNVVGRYGQFDSADLWGLGLRYRAPTLIRRMSPSMSIGTLFSKLNHPLVDQWTLSFDLAVSIDYPYIHPYLGVAYDRSELGLTPDGRRVLGRSTRVKTDGFRAAAGVKISPVPFTFVSLSLGMANDGKLVNLGMGAYF